MAVAKGKKVEEVEFKNSLLTGIGTVQIVAINPSKDELSKLYGREIEKSPEYISEKDGIKNLRLDFYIKSVVDSNNGIDFIKKVTLFLRGEYFYSKTKDKVQVIDKYGDSQWLFIEEEKAGTIPERIASYDMITTPYKKAIKGEAELVAFIKTFLGIQGRKVWDTTTGSYVQRPDLSNAEAQLDKINEYFKGNIKELRDIINYQPDNKVKVVFGVKTSDDGKFYQDVYPTLIHLNATNKYIDKIEIEINNKKALKMYESTEFTFGSIQEITPTPSDVVYNKPTVTPNVFTNNETTEELPF